MNKKKIILLFVLGLCVLVSYVGYKGLKNKETKSTTIQTKTDTSVSNSKVAITDLTRTNSKSTIKDTFDGVKSTTKPSNDNGNTNVTPNANEINAKANNTILKVENNKYYLSDNRIINISSDTFIGDKKEDVLVKKSKSARLFSFHRNGKDINYVYSAPVKEQINIGDVKGTEITGVLKANNEGSLQLESDIAHKVSLNCVVYDSIKVRSNYKSSINKLYPNIIVKLFIINEEIQNILIF